MPTKPEPVLDIRDLVVHFQLQGGALSRLLGLGVRTVKAVDGVNLTLARGEVLGVVGESGSGKTTLGRALLGLVATTDGEVVYHDRERGERRVSHMRGRELRQLRTDLQMVFQDPHAALNPSMTIEEAVGHPLVIHGIAKGDELRRRVGEALERVGLAPVERFLSKYPSDLSGGQKQRAVIARAIILDPEVLVADEPVSMLDMSVRAKILQLMLDLKTDLGLTYVYITHDLASAKYFCDRIAIMYLGRVVEVGPTEEVFANPRHPYTKALLKAIPEPDPERMVPRDLPRGEIPDAAVPPLGCSFHPRCPEATSICGWESRDLRALIEEHWTRGSAETYARERDLVGDLEHLDRPDTRPRVGAGGALEVRGLLAEMRAEDPDEPLWLGVDAIDDDGDGVRVSFHPGEDPQLRAAGDVDVACVLYP
ncbi:ABC transporter ATP-binding protein [Nocardioides sp.]|uniref:ABC transporter ATP-binding protein n=1 Tax=Nocardioides sp. TaxID=35761 RepID=UPI0031FEDD9F|nr:gsiA 2 [Nocardioides sp.]